MSLKYMVEAFDSTVGNSLRKLILIKLADHANDDGECWPSFQYIADACETTRRSVITHISELEKAGFLRVINRKKDENLNHTNIYKLTISNGVVSSPAVENFSLGSEGDSLGGSEGDSPGSEGDSLGGSEGDSPRTCHSFEPVNEPRHLWCNPYGLQPKKSKFTYPDWFDQLWKNYPSRSGANDKRKALRAAKARLDDGKTVDDLTNALARYRIYVKQSGRWGSEFVLQAATFFGPGGHIDNDWSFNRETSKPGSGKDARSFAQRQRDQARTALANINAGPESG